MGVFNKRLSEINYETINELVSSKVLESKYLDYKQDISHTLKNDETKIKILKDIVSFANSQGGDIIIGVTEKGGVPIKITGIDLIKVDEIIDLRDSSRQKYFDLSWFNFKENPDIAN